jgi:SAM-dependent methyltransferase
MIVEDKETGMQTAKGNDEQATMWNGSSGEGWVAAQAVLDRMFAPFETMLAAPVGPGMRVLDVGCGTGAVTLAAARKAGAAGQCLGVDISEPMIALARRRAAQEGLGAEFTVADAQVAAFAPAQFDLLVSRFGVMFFADPVAAFANLRAAARPDAGLRMIAWRAPEENSFMTAVEREVAPLLPELPPRPAGAAGQFGFADSARVRRLLEEAGWRDVAIGKLDQVCAIPAADLETYIERVGPVSRFLREADAQKRAQLVAASRKAFAPYRQDEEIRFNAGCWMIEARA